MFLKVPDFFFQKNIVKNIFYKIWKKFLELFSTKTFVYLLSTFLMMHFSFFFFKFCSGLSDLNRDWNLCLLIRDLQLKDYQNQNNALGFLLRTLFDMNETMTECCWFFVFSLVFLILLVSTLYSNFFKK